MATPKKKTASKTKHCVCAAKVNELLAPQNGQLVCSLRMFPAGKKHEFHARAVVECEKVDSIKRGRLKKLVATFCPFCGVEYPEPPVLQKGDCK